MHLLLLWGKYGYWVQQTMVCWINLFSSIINIVVFTTGLSLFFLPRLGGRSEWKKDQKNSFPYFLQYWPIQNRQTLLYIPLSRPFCLEWERFTNMRPQNCIGVALLHELLRIRSVGAIGCTFLNHQPFHLFLLYMWTSSSKSERTLVLQRGICRNYKHTDEEKRVTITGIWKFLVQVSQAIEKA